MQTDCFINDQLLAEIALGNEVAFGRLFDYYKHKIYSYAHHFSHSDTIAEEVTQEVFLKVWMNRTTLNGINDLDAWLSVITRNACFNQLRKLAQERKLKTAVAAKSELADDDTVQYVLYKDRLQQLQLAMQQLTPQQRMIFRLNREQGMKNEEISRQLNLSPNTVKTHMVSALRKIRDFFEAHPGCFFLFFFPFI